MLPLTDPDALAARSAGSLPPACFTFRIVQNSVARERANTKSVIERGLSHQSACQQKKPLRQAIVKLTQCAVD